MPAEYFAESGLVPLWDPDSDSTLVCRQVRQETHDVKTFVFSAIEPRIFKFLPGQFMTFTLPVGSDISRCYTISSSAGRPYRISITVKRVPGGQASNWLHDNMRPGTQIQAYGPAGSFTTDATDGAKLLFLSAGSGITPMMSMTRTAFDLEAPSDLIFAHGARTPRDIIFRRELALLASQSPTFRLAYFCEDSEPSDDWVGFNGRLTRPMLQLIAPDIEERRIFCCGPVPFLQSVQSILNEIGFSMTQYSQEEFELSTNLTMDVTPREDAGDEGGFRVTLGKSGKTVACSASTTLLDAARDAGVRIQSACQRGMCGTCKTKLLSGKVDMVHAGGIRQREIDQGMILPCCSYPVSDVEIDI
ncbi:MAG: hybrid-cluster NAD(P)-dependent oxidoreductase [Hyphomonadaceae bacterium]|nr:hybrid-cluster NAD(P)-dependent oxidoreductase [Hyphomonadaceae bacterium]